MHELQSTFLNILKNFYREKKEYSGKVKEMKTSWHDLQKKHAKDDYEKL